MAPPNQPWLCSEPPSQNTKQQQQRKRKTALSTPTDTMYSIHLLSKDILQNSSSNQQCNQMIAVTHYHYRK